MFEECCLTFLLPALLLTPEMDTLVLVVPKADPWSDRASALVGLAVKRSRRDLRVIVFAASPVEPERD